MELEEKDYQDLTREEMYNIIMGKKLDDIVDVLLTSSLTLSERLEQENLSLIQAKQECQEYQDKFQNICRKYALPADNKLMLCRELYKILQRERNDELKWLYCAVICDLGLLLDKAREKRTEEQDILNYLDSSRALQFLKQMISRKEKYKEQINSLLRYKKTDRESLNQNKLFIAEGDVEKIAQIYKNCLERIRGLQEEIFKENISSISWKINAQEDLQRIAPLFFYQVIVNHKARIIKSTDINPVISKLWKYKEYQIEKDNGKNYKMLERLTAFFIQLCEYFFPKDKVDRELTLYGFAHLSNICEWYYDVYKRKDLLYAPLREIAAYDMYDLKQAEEFLPVPLSSVLKRLGFTGFEPEYFLALNRLYGVEECLQEADEFYEEEFTSDSKAVSRIKKYIAEHEKQLEKFIAAVSPELNEIPELVSHILDKTGLSRIFPQTEEKLLLYSVHYLLLELTDDALSNLMQRMERLFTA